MSVQAVSAAFAVRLTSPTDKLVLLALANYAGADGSCWPSSAVIQSDTSLSERAIRNSLGVLERVGLIRREERRRADGTRRTDMVRLLFYQPAQDAACQPAPRAPLTSFEPLPTSEAKASSVRSPKPKAARFVPEAWAPKPQTLSNLEAKGYSSGEVERQLARMRNHEFRSPRSDWDRAFLNWMTSNPPGKSNDKPPTRPSDKFQRKSDNFERADFGAEVAADAWRRENGYQPDSDDPGAFGGMPQSFALIEG